MQVVGQVRGMLDAILNGLVLRQVQGRFVRLNKFFNHFNVRVSLLDVDTHLSLVARVARVDALWLIVVNEGSQLRLTRLLDLLGK